MAEIHRAALEDASVRAVWTDHRSSGKCALVICGGSAEAQMRTLEDSARGTAVRNVENYALYIDTDLGAETISDYVRALAGALDVQIQHSKPDFILNVNTRKFHFPDCGSVEDMKVTNRLEYTGSRDVILEKGYAACKRCHP